MTRFGSLRHQFGLTAALLAVCNLAAVTSAKAQSVSCNPPMANAIVCENSKPGNASTEWDISGSGDSTIQGFSTDISVNQGETVHFKINTIALAYRIDIYRMGYYGGAGARRVVSVSPSSSLPQSQPVCLTDQATGLIDCGNWAESASWTVPPDATSGIYFAKLVRSDTGGASHIFFVVRADSANSAVLFKTSDTTWQAYNTYGGNDLYSSSSPTGPGRAYKVSYNRPSLTRDSSNNVSWVFNAEYPMVRWLEANGYDVSYFTSVDADRYGSLLLNHKLVLSVGHDEYWSGNERANFEAARAAAVHLAFFSGNEVFWKTRWENSVDGTASPYRTLVCYKETVANAPIDPADPPSWTGTWRDPRFSPPADGGRPENALTGTIYWVNGWRRDSIIVPATYGPLRFWRNTSIATLGPGTSYTFPIGTLGMEWDQDVDNGFRPAGLIDLSQTVVDVSDSGSYLKDYGSVYGNGVATHSLTLYRATSGALVFGAGTVQWSWGLDSVHDNVSTNGTPVSDPNMQQATVNLFADMGIQPATLQPGLVAAVASTDTLPPASTITSPAAGSTVPPENTVTITGSASDVGGGVVAGVEVSVDDGATWHRGSGLNNWTYSWTPNSSGQVTLRSRATDDSLNMEIPSAGVAVTVGPVTLSSLTVNPANVTGGNSSTGTVTLNGLAPAGGAQVALSSNNTSAAQAPASMTIPAGATSATFTVTTSPVVFSNNVTISGSYTGTTQTANLAVLSPIPWF